MICGEGNKLDEEADFGKFVVGVADAEECGEDFFTIINPLPPLLVLLLLPVGNVGVRGC